MEYQFTVRLKGKVTVRGAYSEENAFNKAKWMLQDTVLGYTPSLYGTIELEAESLHIENVWEEQ